MDVNNSCGTLLMKHLDFYLYIFFM